MTRFEAPLLHDIRSAAARIAPHARVTPVLRSPELDAHAGAALFFKCEHLQVGGAFKFRGACNAVWALSDDVARRGVATHSSGNHGAALALAAKTRGIAAHVVVPEGAVAAKVAAIRAYGATLHVCAPTLAARDEAAARIARETGATLVHPFTNEQVIAGQGTIGLELLEQVANLEAVVVPIGGGGLISGIACAIKETNPKIRVVGVQTEKLPSMLRASESGKTVTIPAEATIADGIAVRRAGELTFPLVQRYVDEIVTVDEEEIAKARKFAVESWAEQLAYELAALGIGVGIIEPGGYPTRVMENSNPRSTALAAREPEELRAWLDLKNLDFGRKSTDFELLYSSGLVTALIEQFHLLRPMYEFICAVEARRKPRRPTTLPGRPRSRLCNSGSSRRRTYSRPTRPANRASIPARRSFRGRSRQRKPWAA